MKPLGAGPRGAPLGGGPVGLGPRAEPEKAGGLPDGRTPPRCPPLGMGREDSSRFSGTPLGPAPVGAGPDGEPLCGRPDGLGPRAVPEKAGGAPDGRPPEGRGRAPEGRAPEGRAGLPLGISPVGAGTSVSWRF